MNFRFRIKELMKEKEERTGQIVNYHRIGLATGLNSGRVKAYAESDLTRFDAKALDAFMDFFDCSICDLFEDLPDAQ